jgi:hypothetical protein
LDRPQLLFQLLLLPLLLLLLLSLLLVMVLLLLLLLMLFMTLEDPEVTALFLTPSSDAVATSATVPTHARGVCDAQVLRSGG